MKESLAAYVEAQEQAATRSTDLRSAPDLRSGLLALAKFEEADLSG